MKVRNARTGKETASRDKHLFPAMCVAFSRDGRRLAAAYWSTPGRVVVWRLPGETG